MTDQAYISLSGISLLIYFAAWQAAGGYLAYRKKGLNFFWIMIGVIAGKALAAFSSIGIFLLHRWLFR